METGPALDRRTRETLICMEFAATVLRNLRPVSIGLAALYAFFAISHQFFLPQPIANVMSVLAGLTAGLLFILYLALRRPLLPQRRAHPIAGGVALLVFLNSLTHLVLTGDILQTTNLMLLITGAGFLLLSTPWLIAVISIALVAWGSIIVALGTPPLWVHFAFGLFSATTLSILMHITRRNTLRHAESLRLDDQYHAAALQVALQAAKRSEERFRDLADNASDLIQSVDAKGRIVYVNRAWEETLGYTAEEAIGMSLFDIIHPDSQPHCRRILDSLTAGEPCDSRLEATFLTKDGRSILVEGSVNCHFENGHPLFTRGIYRDITERKQMETLLKHERDFVSAILETAAALIVVLDHEGRIVRFNRTCERTTGYAAEEVIGQFVWDLFLPPEEIPGVRRVFKTLVAGDFPNQYENAWLTRDGQRRLIAWSNTALLDDGGDIEYVVATGIDVTEQRRAERERNERRRYLEAVLSAVPDAIVTLDAKHRIMEWNSGAEKLFGYRRDEVVGLELDPLITQEDSRARARELTMLVMQGTPVPPHETVRYRKDGKPVPVVVAGAPITVESELVGAVAIYTDITALKEAQEALRQRTRELEAQNAELDAFAHTVAHDIKGPVGNLYTYALLLAEDFTSFSQETLHEALTTIASTAHRVVNIVDALLLLGSLRGAEVQTEPLDMGPIVASALERLTFMTEEYHAEIIQPDAWPTVLGYAPWVEEIWVNYISNAIKYGGRPPRVELGATEESDGTVRFWVRDNGKGLTEEEQRQLFTPFTRLSQVRAEGYGLGLSIVRRIADRLGGDVGVVSAPGKGSEFWFKLPLARSPSITTDSML